MPPRDAITAPLERPWVVRHAPPTGPSRREGEESVLHSEPGPLNQRCPEKALRGSVSGSGRGTMRILHCIPSMLGGGAERQVCYLAEELVRRGHQVDVALLQGGPNLERLEAVGARVHWLPPLQHAWDPRGPWHLRAVMRETGAEVVQTWLTRMDAWGGLAARSLGLPWIFSERSGCVFTSSSMADRGFRALIGQTDYVVANSESAATAWRGYLGPAHKIAVVSNALPVDEIARAPLADRAALGVAEGAPFVLFSGRFQRAKGTAALAQALARLLPSRPALHAVACGVGPSLDEFRRIVDAAGVGARVLTPGYRNDLWSLMRSASVLVSPSHLEGRPNVVMEAMAAGVPLALSTIGPHRELVPEAASQWFDIDDVAAMTRAMAAVLDDPEGAAVRVEAARAVLGAHAASVMAEAYEKVYREVLRARR